MDEIEYVFPPMKLLSAPRSRSGRGQMTERNIKETAVKLQNTLESFGVHVTVTNVSCGPAVTRYELQPEQGVKVKSITSLADDIKLNLAASEVRIEAPIPGKIGGRYRSAKQGKLCCYIKRCLKVRNLPSIPLILHCCR